MKEFSIETKICIGDVAIAMDKLAIARAFIICDPFLKQSGKVDVLTTVLENSNSPYMMFSEITPDPTISLVTQIVEQVRKFTPTAIIALGGGSAIDAAKAVRYIYQQMKPEAVCRLIAIPTTSGTGSEVTAFSVITDSEAQAKYPLIDNSMLPDIALLDANLTRTVPSAITADTGMDVLTHALEAVVSLQANDFTNASAYHAIWLVKKHLLPAVKNGEDLAAREGMHNASCLAGIAFNQAGLGICHSMAHALGATFHLPHGRSNAMLLPHIVAFNSGLVAGKVNEVAEKYGEIARLWGLGECHSKQALMTMFIRQIKQLMKAIQVPVFIEETGILADDFEREIPQMAQKALLDKCTSTNPVTVTVKDLENIYRQLLRNGGY